MIATVARNALRLGHTREVARKLWARARYGTREAQQARAWAAENAQDLNAWAASLDAVLWEEAKAAAAQIQVQAAPKLQELKSAGVTMGGAGALELLHFLVRLRRPDVVLETGVAAGWSTTALLTALNENGSGHLLSSDFPYLRIQHAERYIGFLVPEELKVRWTLRLRGDRVNLDELLTTGSSVQLVHYDSDKSRGGREFFMRRMREHISTETVLVFDDINDDLFFRDQARAHGGREVHVFPYESKFIGVLGI